MDRSLPNSSVRGILQARILKSMWPCPPGDLSDPEIKPKSPSLQVDSVPAEPQGSPRIPVWVAYPFSSSLPNPGMEPGSPALQEDSLPTELSGKPLILKINCTV